MEKDGARFGVEHLIIKVMNGACVIISLRPCPSNDEMLSLEFPRGEASSGFELTSGCFQSEMGCIPMKQSQRSEWGQVRSVREDNPGIHAH